MGACLKDTQLREMYFTTPFFHESPCDSRGTKRQAKEEREPSKTTKEKASKVVTGGRGQRKNDEAKLTPAQQGPLQARKGDHRRQAPRRSVDLRQVERAQRLPVQLWHGARVQTQGLPLRGAALRRLPQESVQPVMICRSHEWAPSRTPLNRHTAADHLHRWQRYSASFSSEYGKVATSRPLEGDLSARSFDAVSFGRLAVKNFECIGFATRCTTEGDVTLRCCSSFGRLALRIFGMLNRSPAQASLLTNSS